MQQQRLLRAVIGSATKSVRAHNVPRPNPLDVARRRVCRSLSSTRDDQCSELRKPCKDQKEDIPHRRNPQARATVPISQVRFQSSHAASVPQHEAEVVFASQDTSERTLWNEAKPNINSPPSQNNDSDLSRPQAERMQPKPGSKEDGTSRPGPTASTPFSATVDQTCFSNMLQVLRSVRACGLPDAAVIAPPAPQKTSRLQIQKKPQQNPRWRSPERLKRFKMYSSKEPLKKRLEERSKLPIMDPKVGADFLRLTELHDVVVVVSATGSGKTTQIPQLLLDHAIREGRATSCNIVCTQPRKISATSIARRVAYERCTKLGEEIGFQVRFSSLLPAVDGSILYCTTGVLSRRLQADAENVLQSYSHIIVDEVHVRDVPIDVLLASLRTLVRKRKEAGQPSPKIILMSATIESHIFATYFKQAAEHEQPLRVASISVPGHTFPVTPFFLNDILHELQAKYDSDPAAKSLLQGTRLETSTKDYLKHEREFSAERLAAAQVSSSGQDDFQNTTTEGSTVSSFAAPDDESLVPSGLIVLSVFHILSTSATGDMLVFLPGIAEIDKVSEMLQDKDMPGIDLNDTSKFRIFKLHSTLSDTNDEVFEPLQSGCRRIVLATNIAETSITLPQVTHVVDSGKVREMRFDQLTGTSRFSCKWISKASSMQRRGRAGRVQNGNYYALFSKERYESLDEKSTPEILRSDLVEVCLDIKAQTQDVGIESFLADAIDPPDALAVKAAVSELKILGALNEEEILTPLGALLATVPLHPSLSKAVLLGILFRCLRPMLIIACHSREDALLNHANDRAPLYQAKRDFAGQSQSDHFSFINAFQEYESAEEIGGFTYATNLRSTKYVRGNVYHEMLMIARQIYQVLAHTGLVPPPPSSGSIIQGLPSDLNTNADHINLVKALALVSVSSNIAAWKIGDARDTRWVTKDSPKSLLHFSSVNEIKRHKEAQDLRRSYSNGQLMAYSSKKSVAGDKYPWLIETSMITPLVAVMFAGTSQLEGKDIVCVNDWLRLIVQVGGDNPPFPLKEPGRVLIEFRKAFDRFQTLAFSDLHDMSLQRDEQGQQGQQGHGDKQTFNQMFTEKSALREAMVNGMIDILDRDAQAWDVIRAAALQAARDAREVAERGREVPGEGSSEREIDAI